MRPADQWPRRAFVAALLLCVPALAAARAGTSVEYGPLPGAHNASVVPIPGGFAASAYGEHGGVLLTAKNDGTIRASRSLGENGPLFLTATGAGDIYVGMIDSEGRRTSVARLNRNLELLWSRRIVHDDGTPLVIHRATATRDGGLVLTAELDLMTVVVKLRPNGSVQWSTALDASSSEELDVIRETADGYVAEGANRMGAWLVKFDAAGNLRWQKTYRGNSFSSLLIAQDGSIVTAGGGGGARIMKFDRDGNHLWNRALESMSSVRSIIEVEDGFAATVSVVDSPREEPIGKTIVVQWTHGGALIWQRAFLPGNDELLYFVHAPQDAMLLSAVDGVKLIAGVGKRLLLSTLDRANGSTTCGWFVDGSLMFASAESPRVDEVTVEVTHPRMRTEATPPSLSRISLLQSSAECPPATARMIWADAVPPSKTREFRSRGDDPAMEKSYRDLFLARNFSELENHAARLRRDRPSRDPMRPNAALRAFYDVFASDETAPEGERLRLLREWVSGSPHSVTALLALVGALDGAAWKRRGGDFWNAVTATDAAAFEELSGQARAIMDRLGHDAESDASYWYLKISLSCGDDEMLAIGRRALTLHQDPDLAFNVSRCLHPNWGGSVEEVVSWADEAAQLTRGTYGDAVYMWIAYKYEDDPLFRSLGDRGFPWQRIQKGFGDILRKAPEWLPSYHRYAKLAHQHNEHALAQTLFQRPELDWYEEAVGTWGMQAAYEHSREWALVPWTGSTSLTRRRISPPVQPVPNVTPSPAVPTPVAALPAQPPRGEVTAVVTPSKWGRVVQKSNALHLQAQDGATAFLVQTANGLIAISAASRAAVSTPSRSVRGLEPLQRWSPQQEPPTHPYFLVACASRGGQCVQTVLPAKLHGWNVSSGKRIFLVGLTNKPDDSLLLSGSAFVNERQEVLGVVIGSSTSTFPGAAFVVDAADLANVLPP